LTKSSIFWSESVQYCEDLAPSLGIARLAKEAELRSPALGGRSFLTVSKRAALSVNCAGPKWRRSRWRTFIPALGRLVARNPRMQLRLMLGYYGETIGPRDSFYHCGTSFSYSFICW